MRDLTIDGLPPEVRVTIDKTFSSQDERRYIEECYKNASTKEVKKAVMTRIMMMYEAKQKQEYAEKKFAQIYRDFMMDKSKMIYMLFKEADMSIIQARNMVKLIRESLTAELSGNPAIAR